MKAMNILKLTMIASAFAALLAAEAQAASAPRYVRVRNVSFAGSGCPAGSVATRTSADRQGVSFLFDSFLAEVGPGVSFSQKRKNCQINLDLDFPSGWSYAVKKISYSGYAALDSGVSASAQTSLYFQGQGQTGSIRTTLQGPMDRSFRLMDVFSDASAVWSPCGAQRALNINTQLVLNAPSSRAHGLILLDTKSSDLPGGVDNLTLVWKRCR